MKKQILISTLLIITVFSCSKESNNNNNNNGNNTNLYGAGKGQASFFARTDFHIGTLDVLVDNVVIATLSSYNPNGITCEAAPVRKILSIGNHNWQIVAQSGYTVSGTVSISEGQCSLVELPAPLNYIPRIQAKYGADSVILQGSQIQMYTNDRWLNTFSCDNTYSIMTERPGGAGYYLPRMILGKSQTTSIVGQYSVVNLILNGCSSTNPRITAAIWNDAYGIWTENNPPYNTGFFKVTFYEPTSRRISGEFSYLLNNNVPLSGKFYNLILP